MHVAKWKDILREILLFITRSPVGIGRLASIDDDDGGDDDRFDVFVDEEELAAAFADVVVVVAISKQ